MPTDQTTKTATPAKATGKAVGKTASKSAAKPVPQPLEKPAAKTAAKAAAKPKALATAEPSLRFHHSSGLRTKTDAVLSAIEAEPDHPKHGNTLADLVHELIEAGMDYYFLRALKQAQMGFVTEQSAKLGMSGAVKLISSVTRKFVLRMNQDQLLVVVNHIRGLT
jgi:hypothetical protein